MLKAGTTMNSAQYKKKQKQLHEQDREYKNAYYALIYLNKILVKLRIAPTFSDACNVARCRECLDYVDRNLGVRHT